MKILILALALTLAGCGKKEPSDMVLPPGAKFIKEIGQNTGLSAEYTIEVEIDNERYIWVYFGSGHGRIGSLTKK